MILKKYISVSWETFNKNKKHDKAQEIKARFIRDRINIYM